MNFVEGRQRIAIEGLEIEAAIGLLDWEKQQKQRLRIDAAVYRDDFGAETSLTDCYDYSALQAFLAAYAERPQIELLETMLAEILDYCFDHPSVVAAEVCLTKPDVFQGLGMPVVSAALTKAQWAAKKHG
jgi:dihydroneopterin aldolase